jgi:drug/metabolite transporter (DMT)-like permease
MIAWYYLILGSSLLVGIASIVEKYALKKQFATAYSTSFSFIIALISIIFLPFAKFNLTALSLVLIYIFSLIATFTYLIAARVLRHSQVSASSPMLRVLPSAFVVLLAIPILSENLTPLQYLSVAVIIIASYLMFFGRPGTMELFKGKEKKKYIYLLVGNAILIAIGSIINKYVLYTVDPYTFLILTEVFIAINFIIIISVRYNGVKEMFTEVKNYKYPILAIAILTTASRIMYYLALLVTPITTAQPLSNVVSVIVIVLVGGIIFKEGSIKKKLALSVIIMAAAVLLII